MQRRKRQKRKEKKKKKNLSSSSFLLGSSSSSGTGSWRKSWISDVSVKLTKGREKERKKGGLNGEIRLGRSRSRIRRRFRAPLGSYRPLRPLWERPGSRTIRLLGFRRRGASSISFPSSLETRGPATQHLRQTPPCGTLDLNVAASILSFIFLINIENCNILTFLR